MPKHGGINRKKIKDSSRGGSDPTEPAAGSKKAAASKKRSKSKGTSQQSLSAAQLFERAQAAIAFERYDAALECMKDALELEPENLEIIDARGALLAELGREEEAVQVGVACLVGGEEGGSGVHALHIESVAGCRIKHQPTTLA